mmetsp:Transcript_29501/g.51813  ORF Transcript_29501/g.51813 Transcript_29501/m.51813 type:complete len:85 (-) Transcript_29501:3098-3352(-)
MFTYKILNLKGGKKKKKKKKIPTTPKKEKYQKKKVQNQILITCNFKESKINTQCFSKKCPNATYLADHSNRSSCGRCGMVCFKK